MRGAATEGPRGSFEPVALRSRGRYSNFSVLSALPFTQ